MVPANAKLGAGEENPRVFRKVRAEVRGRDRGEEVCTRRKEMGAE